MILYLVEFFLLHSLFYLVYKVFLAKETQLGFLRFFLIGSTLLSLIIPAIEIPGSSSLPNLNLAPTILPIIELSSTSDATLSIPWYGYLIASVSLGLLLKLAVNLFHIIRIYKKSIPKFFAHLKIRSVEGLENSFTYFKWIFIDTNHFDRPEEIILHEQGHAKKLHSIDITLFHLLAIPFWWTPSIWLMMKELKNIHEFEADAFALKSIKQETYTKTLVQSTLRAHGMNLASSFDDASIFNRLNFIKKMKKKINPWKVVSIAALVAISGAMFACEDELNSEIKRIAEESNQNIEYSDEVQIALAKLKKENPDKEYVVVETLADNEASLKKLQSYDPKQIESIFVNKKNGEKTVTMIVNTESELFAKTIEIQENANNVSSGDDEGVVIEIMEEKPVFTIVEEAASFPGGLEAWGQYLLENMKYPEAAIENNITGRVFVQFIVEVNGELSDVHVVKGIGGGCDEEAVRVVANGPNWISGKQKGVAIRQKMIQNIMFQF
ncbi:MAG: energy transducer TonB [Ekhidna sp.]